MPPGHMGLQAMRILFLSYRLPYSGSISGQRIVYQRILRLAERGYEVGLAALIKETDLARTESLRDVVMELETVPLPPRYGRAGSFCHRRDSGVVPPPFASYYSPEMERLVGNMVHRSRYDLVIAEQYMVGQYLYRNRFLPAVRTIYSCHQSPLVANHKRIELLGASPRTWGRRFWRHRLKRYELSICRAVDRVLVLTPEDHAELRTMATDVPITVIRSGVDLNYFRPPARSRKPPASPSLLYTGHFTDEPNRDAMRWFVRHVWPQVSGQHPDLQFHILGPNADAEMRQMARRDPRIVLTGMQGDIRPFLHDSTVFVCPLRLGSGLRGKVVEAMAAGLPVVSTSLGVEGIPAQTGYNCLIADRAEIMARQIGLLLEDETLRQKLALHARKLVEERFSWDVGINRFEELILDTARSASPR